METNYEFQLYISNIDLRIYSFVMCSLEMPIKIINILCNK